MPQKRESVSAEPHTNALLSIENEDLGLSASENVVRKKPTLSLSSRRSNGNQVERSQNRSFSARKEIETKRNETFGNGLADNTLIFEDLAAFYETDENNDDDDVDVNDDDGDGDDDSEVQKGKSGKKAKR
ncbi:hypothetical protein HZH68_015685 [Vespula germanica]|uniref:Uncharacterized protein n=1 Tax=Vespula germanica TaxID=30212 RepID=A0A834MQP3_VESGE|nr:hypothetical protein HZH68_015685 [Vespula germanica]